MSIFNSPFLTTSSPGGLLTKSRRCSSNQSRRDDKVTKSHRSYGKKNLTFSLLDDFESGNTNLDDIFEFPSRTSTAASLRVPQTFQSRKDEFDALLLDRPFLDHTSFYQELNIENGIRMSHTADLDFNNIQKLTIELDPELQRGYDEDGNNDLIESMVHDLSIDEIDAQVRSNHGDNHLLDDEDQLQEHDDLANEIHNILESNSNYGSNPNHNNHIDLEDIFEPADFDDYDFGNADSFDYDERYHDLHNIPVSYNPIPFGSSTQKYRLYDSANDAAPYIYEDKEFSTSADRSPRRACLPSKHVPRSNIKPALRPRRNLLNLIVDSSDGNLDDATKYATEINSQNCQGIPIPEKITEVVTIPTSGPQIGGVRKAAIVKAIYAKTQSSRQSSFHHHQSHNNNNSNHNTNNATSIENGKISKVTLTKSSNKHLGFYTADEQKDFLKQHYNRDTEINTEKNIHTLGSHTNYGEHDSEDKENQARILASKLVQPKGLTNNSASSRNILGLHTQLSISSRKKVTWAEGLEW